MVASPGEHDWRTTSQADYNRLLSTVPFEEDDKDPRTWFLDHNYIESMNEIGRASCRERVS